jgi:hypothetical protein
MARRRILSKGSLASAVDLHRPSVVSDDVNDLLRRAERKVARDLARERLDARVNGIMDEYLRLAEGGRVKNGSSPATIRHAVDNLLPPEQKLVHSGNIAYVTNLPKEED